MVRRLYAYIQDVSAKPKVIHTIGYPKKLVGDQQQILLPWPNVIIIKETSEGFFLVRYDLNGAFCGDTWHLNLEDAINQAKYEYGSSLGEWINIPSDIDDPLKYALENKGIK